jgi:hypothetical protein
LVCGKAEEKSRAWQVSAVGFTANQLFYLFDVGKVYSNKIIFPFCLPVLLLLNFDWVSKFLLAQNKLRVI